MAILVEEGLHPNGTDLVKEARLNPVARANAEPQRMVRAIPLGEDLAVIGLALEPMIAEEDGEQYFAAVLSVIGGRESKFVPTVPVKLVLGELARLKLSDLREKLAQAIDGPKKEEAQQ
jgi:hypothetical protein